MNFQTAGIVAGAAFALSFIAGLIGGVPLFDILVRALVWGGVGFGGSLGVESVLRSLVPDLFGAAEEPEPEAPAAAETGRSVNITLEEEAPRSVLVEEEDQDAPAPAPRPAPEASPAPSSAPASAGADEEMPEIGAFLDAFKPGSAEGAEEEGSEGAPTQASAGPEIGEYAPEVSSSSSGEVTIDGEVQDPALLARAVQTVLKRDAQGS